MKVLVLKADHLGDFALSLPTLWEMVQHLGTHNQIRILAHPANMDWGKILSWLPEMETIRHPRYDWGEAQLILLWELREQMHKLREGKYDLGIDLMGASNDPWARRLLKWAGCKEIIEGDRGGQAFTGGIHETRNIARRLPREWMVSGETSPLEFMPSEFRKRGLGKGGESKNLKSEKAENLKCGRAKNGEREILLAPAVRTSAKGWPEEYWKQLIQRLPANQTSVLVPPDDPQCGFWKWVSNGQLQEPRSISDTLKLLQRSSVVVTLDTAVAHYAWLVGAPIIQLFAGTAEVTRWGTLADGKILRHPVSCAPCKQEQCFRSQHECMINIPVEKVLAAIQDCLNVPGS